MPAVIVVMRFFFLVCLFLVSGQESDHVLRVLRQLDRLQGQVEYGQMPDGYQLGIESVSQRDIFIGENRETMDDFCDGASVNLTGHRIIVFNRRQAGIDQVIVNATVTVPNTWIRDLFHGVDLLFCSGSEVVRRTVNKSHMNRQKKETFLPLRREWLESQTEQIAIVLDNRWNHRTVVKDVPSLFVIQTSAVQTRPTVTKICDTSLGREQGCCRWPVKNESRNRVLFHRCLERVPDQLLPSSRELPMSKPSLLAEIQRANTCGEKKSRLVEVRTGDGRGFDQQRAQKYTLERDDLECLGAAN